MANCYCQERTSNPRVTEMMKDIPAGYCGLCEICGEPGHTRGHPSLPTTGAWCENHWKEIAKTSNKYSPTQILVIALILIPAVILIVRML